MAGKGRPNNGQDGPPPGPDGFGPMQQELPRETVELPWSTYRWVPGSTAKNIIPSGGLQVGTDVDGDDIYAARCYHERDVLPAKLIPAKNKCYIAHSGKEIAKDEFEMLVPDPFSWQFSTEGKVPSTAVVVGHAASGEKLYFGRVNHDNCVTPGKIHPSHGCCYYPFDGFERKSMEYEVLILM